MITCSEFIRRLAMAQILRELQRGPALPYKQWAGKK